MTDAVTGLAIVAGSHIRAKLRHPRRGVDERGRNVQFPQWKGYVVLEIIEGAFGIVALMLGAVFVVQGEYGAIALFPCGFLCLLLAYAIHQVPRVWYYEDDDGFEILSRFLHKKISMSYQDIASWKIEGELVLKGHNGTKVSVPLPLVRPLKLLNVLVTMEAQGRFGKYDIQRRRAIIEGEFDRQINFVREEMKETGVHIDIPDH